MPILNYVNGMVYHAAIGKCVSIGFDQRTWLWDGTNWTRLDITGPGPRGEHAICYDPNRQRTVLFGGFKQGASAYNSETWEFDGSSWTLITSTGPSPRGNARMIYDPGGARVLLYGGSLATVGASGEIVSMEMWSWNGTAWSNLGAQGPSPPSNSTGTYLGPSTTQTTPIVKPPPFLFRSNYSETAADAVDLAGLGFGFKHATFQSFSRIIVDTFGTVHFHKVVTDNSGTFEREVGRVSAYTDANSGIYNNHPEDRSGIYYFVTGGEFILEWHMVTRDGGPWSIQMIFTENSSAVRFQYNNVPGGQLNIGTGGAVYAWSFLDNFGDYVGTNETHPSVVDPNPITNTACYGWTFDDTVNQPNGDAIPTTPSRSWTELASTTPQFPEDRTYHGFAWHTASSHAVLAGGYSDSFATWQDTWTWNGAWTRAHVGSPFDYRTEIQLAYDSARSRTVLFGGNFDPLNQFTNQTLEWNGSTWTVVRAADTDGLGGSAAPSYFHTDGGVAFDSSRSVVVLTDGQAEGLFPHMGETWEWNGTAWTRKTNYPPPRRGPAAYDEARGEFVVGPGITNGTGTFVSEERPVFTWRWNGSTWTRSVLVPASGITSWFGAMMAYDSVRERIVLFGGSINGSASNRIFVWDGSAWTEKTPGSGNPSGRRDGLLFFDPTISKCVQWGGNGGAGETWLWDGTAWTQWTQGGATPASDDRVCGGYDFGRDKGVLYRRTATQTWEWTGGTGWVQVTTAANPGTRDEAGMAYSGNNTMILYGGATLNANVWEYDGTNWTDLGAATGQLTHGRRGHAMVYNPDLGGPMFYSGQDREYQTYWNDIWTYGGLIVGAWAWHETAPAWSMI